MSLQNTQNEQIIENRVVLKRFCPACGTRISVNHTFCKNCGFKIKEEAVLPDKTQNIQQNMENFEIQSKSDINLSKNKPTIYADLGDRFIALLLDGIIFSVIGSLMGISLGFGGLWRGYLINAIIGLIYFWAFETINGQTPGKMAMKIQTVDENSLGKISSGQAALHVIGKVLFLPIDFILGVIVKGDDPSEEHKYRITQNISKTVVVKI
ncbi:MAG: RDD family protein [Promethearchaeota archaeon]